MKKIFYSCLCVSLVMFAFSFALAPLYNTFCKLTGVPRLLSEKAFFDKEDKQRFVQIQFTTTRNENLPWDFYPETQSVSTHPGQLVKVFFFAKNNTQRSMTIQAVPSIVPNVAVSHFHKIQCFCFEQQTLKAGESTHMPVVFDVDKSLPRDIHTITLAYTLFEAKK